MFRSLFVALLLVTSVNHAAVLEEERGWVTKITAVQPRYDANRQITTVGVEVAPEIPMEIPRNAILRALDRVAVDTDPDRGLSVDTQGNGPRTNRLSFEILGSAVEVARLFVHRTLEIAPLKYEVTVIGVTHPKDVEGHTRLTFNRPVPSSLGTIVIVVTRDGQPARTLRLNTVQNQRAGANLLGPTTYLELARRWNNNSALGLPQNDNFRFEDADLINKEVRFYSSRLPVRRAR